MRIQLWSYNYSPEPTGIGPLSRAWAKAMMERGHDVEIVAAHPHYPEPAWGSRRLPYREIRDGLPILRLPLWVGRQTAMQRIRQELTFAGVLALASPWLGNPDVIVAVSPSFPALGPAMLNARMRRLPWVLWLQDILPDGASATGLVDAGVALNAARRFERHAYRAASQIVVLSDNFRRNLRAKAVADAKITRIYNPASRPVATASRPAGAGDPKVVLTMGNIGYSQNLAAMVRAFESDADLRDMAAQFVLAGDGMAGDDVRAAIATDRVHVTGIVDHGQLTVELDRAAVALVSQHCGGAEFNVPSKLMNFMGHGLATVASVAQDSEVARILTTSRGGWVTDSSRPEEAARTLAEVLKRPDEIARRGANALEFARHHFTASHCAERFEGVLEMATAGSSRLKDQRDARLTRVRQRGAEARAA
jgi:colanic acid biosynthesis glycosyl transferase WcaI